MGPDEYEVHQIDPDGDLVLYTPGQQFQTHEKDAAFLVSSKHMTLASPWFKACLSNRWSQGRASADGERTKIAIKDCKLSALHVLLMIIHGFAHKVPRQISFRMLFDIALGSDFYQCAEVVQAFALLWVNDSSLNPPIITSDNLSEWIVIAWVFRLDNLLSLATTFAAETSTAPFDALNLPIPAFIRDGIDRNRELWLNGISGLIEDHIGTLVHESPCPNPTCNQSYLAYILQQLTYYRVGFRFILGHSLPPPTTSYLLPGLSVSTIRSMTKSYYFITEIECYCGDRCENRNAPWGEAVSEYATEDCAGVKMPQ